MHQGGHDTVSLARRGPASGQSQLCEGSERRSRRRASGTSQFQNPRICSDASDEELPTAATVKKPVLVSRLQVRQTKVVQGVGAIRTEATLSAHEVFHGEHVLGLWLTTKAVTAPKGT